MTKPATSDAIERFRAIADPARYRANAEQHKQELIQQGERIMLEFELTADDPNVDETGRDQRITNLEQAMDSVLWRIDEIDNILAAYTAGAEAGMNRKVRRKLMKGGGIAQAAGASSTTAGVVKGELDEKLP